MSNPPFIICDADALIQIFAGGNVEPLRCLRSRFGVQPLATEEVEVEVRRFSRYGREIPDGFTKALSKGLLDLLTPAHLRKIIDKFPANVAADGADALWGFAQSRAREYNVRVDLGEAYTHAAAVELGVPALSNDGSAVRSMKENGLALPRAVFRAFDLYALTVQSAPDSIDMGKVLGRLKSKGERFPKVFEHSKFEDALPAFDARVLDATRPAVGNCGSPMRLSPLVAVDQAQLQLLPSVEP